MTSPYMLGLLLVMIATSEGCHACLPGLQVYYGFACVSKDRLLGIETFPV